MIRTMKRVVEVRLDTGSGSVWSLRVLVGRSTVDMGVEGEVDDGI